jgi:hypothetical protein
MDPQSTLWRQAPLELLLEVHPITDQPIRNVTDVQIHDRTA